MIECGRPPRKVVSFGQMSDGLNIEPFVASGDVEGVIGALLAIDESSRRRAAPDVLQALRSEEKAWLDSLDFSRPRSILRRGQKSSEQVQRDRLRVLSAAALCTATGAELGSRRLWVDGPDVARVLGVRQPAWTQQWLDRQFPPGRGGPFGWLDALAIAGLVEVTPTIAASLPVSVGRQVARDRNLADFVRARPWLTDSLWQLFEVEGGGQSSLAACDKYGADWQALFLHYTADGTLDRQRVLDASLEALDRGFSEFRAGWFLRLHEALEPTLDERAERATRYVRLLSSPQGPTQAFSLKALEVLHKERRVDPADLLDGLDHMMGARAKGTVLRAIKLAESIAKTEPTLVTRASETIAVALVHASPEVQARALDVLGRHHAHAVLTPQHVAMVAPSNQARAAALAGADALESPAASIGSGQLADRAPIPMEPVETIEELVEAIAAALENAEQLVLLERALQGISRHCNQESGQAGAALAKRARSLLSRDCPEPTQSLCQVVLAWVARIPPPRLRVQRSVVGFLQGWVWSVAQRAASGISAPLLATPTHEGGWIDPAEAVARTAAVRSFDAADAVLMLLRLSPAGRDQARIAAASVEGELGAALRHALGGDGETIGPSEALWVAAARARAPHADDHVVAQRHRLRHPDAAFAARMSYEFIPKPMPHVRYQAQDDPAGRSIDPHMPTVMMRHRYDGPYSWDRLPGTGADNLALVRWVATVWPQNRDPILEAGVEAVSQNLDWWEAQWHNRGYIEVLLDPALELTRPAYQLLALALAAKDPTESTIAVDAFIAQDRAGQLDINALAGELAQLISWGVTMPSRIAASLAHAWADRPTTVPAVIERSLRPDQAALRGLLPLLELLHEGLVANAARVESGLARGLLESIQGTGKTARVARSLLAL